MDPEQMIMQALMSGGGGGAGAPPPGAAPEEEASSSTEQIIRQMIQLGRQAIDNDDTDPQEMAALEQITTMLQKLVATRHSQDQKAMGVTPQMASMRRAYA